MKYKYWLIGLFSALFVVGISGCSSMSRLVGKFKTYSNLESVTIVRENESNSNQYVLVDIVFVYSDSVQALVEPKSAEFWFSQKDTYLTMSRNKIEVVAHEPIPMGYLDSVGLPERKNKAKHIVVYVAYFGSNEFFQYELTDMNNVKIIISGKEPSIEGN